MLSIHKHIISFHKCSVILPGLWHVNSRKTFLFRNAPTSNMTLCHGQHSAHKLWLYQPCCRTWFHLFRWIGTKIFEKPAISFSRVQEGRQFVCSSDIYLLAHKQCDYIHCNKNLISLHSIHFHLQLYCDFVTVIRRWLAEWLQQWLCYGLDDLGFEPRQGHDIPHSCHVIIRGFEQKATGTVKFTNTTET